MIVLFFLSAPAFLPSSSSSSSWLKFGSTRISYNIERLVTLQRKILALTVTMVAITTISVLDLLRVLVMLVLALVLVPLVPLQRQRQRLQAVLALGINWCRVVRVVPLARVVPPLWLGRVLIDNACATSTACGSLPFPVHRRRWSSDHGWRLRLSLSQRPAQRPGQLLRQRALIRQSQSST